MLVPTRYPSAGISPRRIRPIIVSDGSSVATHRRLPIVLGHLLCLFNEHHRDRAVDAVAQSGCWVRGDQGSTYLPKRSVAHGADEYFEQFWIYCHGTSIAGRGGLPTMSSMDSQIAQHVQRTLMELDATFEVIEIDPDLADTASFCAHYGYSPEASANAIVVASKRPPVTTPYVWCWQPPVWM